MSDPIPGAAVTSHEHFEVLKVPGTLDALDDLAAFVLRAADVANLDKKAAYRLRLAVDEIATNIVTHGYDEAGLNGDITISARLAPHALTVTLEDEAVPYDPLKTTMPDDLAAPLHERDIGGLGVYLTLRGVDEFRYEFVEGRNRNIFVMNCGPQSVTPEVSTRGPSVLLYEGKMSSAALSAALKGCGYAVFGATSPSEARPLLEAGEIEVLIVPDDIDPREAEDLIGGLSALPLGAKPFVLAYATRPDQLNAVRALLGLGAQDYLAGSIEPDLVRVRVEHARERKRLTEHQEDVTKKAALLLIERDVQIGRDIQLSFLPETLPQPSGWELTAFFRPAREVAGDFYDAFELINGRRLAFLIADVCDKGVGAALFMALFRTLVRSNAQQNVSLSWMGKNTSITENRDWLRGDPERRRQSLPSIGTGPLMHAIESTNNYITENHGLTGYFATMFMGLLDPQSGNLIYINAGHNPPVLIRANGERELLKPTGPAVGILPGANFTIQQANLLPGDTLFLHTDGVTDAKDITGRFFTEKRLYGLLQTPAPTARGSIERVRDELLTHIGAAAQFDDITMMCLRRDGDARPSSA
ncbi:SpoIIE family protein phosphatase [Deinococcus yavapaiensis]|uniref:Serine phosphatase RsbU (Regulator of sigma subunit) n=1 Tax=Deinococcus yavapaiensis KR-236 TaxID=694435 RepID=A0A318S9Q6_9DEIO|nr:SpoIIE family protein phosphatase [Deinococcus yavapaiensis]PYE54790.1 serine phosphatase RsbU (regulator of sigma subunit) [Deinococcus yavapaiensis KR-236]